MLRGSQSVLDNWRSASIAIAECRQLLAPEGAKITVRKMADARAVKGHKFGVTMASASRAGLLILTFLLLLLHSIGARAGVWDRPPTCQNGMTWGEECIHGNGGNDFIAQEKNQWIEVQTDSASPIDIRYRMSRTPDDFDCEKAQGTELTLLDNFSVAADKPHRFDLAFGRQWKPGQAVYEWHVCFLIGEKVYRAWRGYDPGPGATLNIHCTIRTEQLREHSADRYLCPNADVTTNPDNYSEYAAHCSDNGCLHFKNKSDYDSWHRFNPLPESEQDQIAKAVLLYSATHPTYLGQNATDFDLYLSVRGHDPSEVFLKTFAGTKLHFLRGSQYQAGHGMRVSIGTFVATSLDNANGGMAAYCGPICAGSEAYTMKKTGNVWNVQSHRLISIS
jgi:hypothetical protein